MEITFEQLPNAVNRLIEKVDNIERILIEKNSVNKTESDQWFGLDELRDYLPDKPAAQTLYGWVHARTIPFHKWSKKLRFLKSEIDDWMKSSKRKTVSEIEQEADNYLIKKKLGKDK